MSITPPKINEPQKPQSVWEQIKSFLTDLFELQSGLDREGTIVNIKNNKRMRGANAWLLMCSIMIASLGLDQNSPAVIIGAMLISPLMSPILGVGLAIGINDRNTLKISVQHFLIAIAIALITSTIYFALTPIGIMNPEIEARTGPTPLDILIAFFGGVAGIVSSSRKDKSNAIPGVAIATALMPPLCVAGFGIANADMKVFLNAFYLFFLNSTFVVLATYLIVRYLDFPVKQHINESEKRKARWIMIATSLIMIIPSLFIFLNIYQKTNTERKIANYLESYFGDRYKYFDESTYFPSDSTSLLVIKMYGNKIDDDDHLKIQQGLSNQNVRNVDVEIIPTSEIDVKDIEAMEAQIDGLSKMKEQFASIKEEKSNRDKLIEDLSFQLDSIKADTVPLAQITNEIRPFFPDIEEISLSRGKVISNGQSIQIPILVLKWPDGKSRSKRNADEKKLRDYIISRAQLDTVKLISY
ncbi:MAG: DUF389 domain-containing protein [Bacteroidota bacterium]